jgi:hypothetical protein
LPLGRISGGGNVRDQALWRFRPFIRTRPNAPPIVVTGPAQAQSETHPLLFTVVDFGE